MTGTAGELERGGGARRLGPGPCSRPLFRSPGHGRPTGVIADGTAGEGTVAGDLADRTGTVAGDLADGTGTVAGDLADRAGTVAGGSDPGGMDADGMDAGGMDADGTVRDGTVADAARLRRTRPRVPTESETHP
ncbi:hypothetical protein [Streptomyces sp. NPDC013455]|uniref:hypothetical protein n=1 Tax=Streptomyces sp. NPDC013455 TaxID=3155605 RepID=UPI00340CD249